MNTYVILRRDGWRDGDELQLAAERSTAAGEEMSEDVRWIRSYVLEEQSGSVGTVCIYQASSPEAIRRHAGAADLPDIRDHPGSRHGYREAGPDPSRKLTAGWIGRERPARASRGPASRRRLWRAAADAGHEGGFAPVRIKTPPERISSQAFG